MVDYLANHLDVKFDVISNLIETDLYSAKVTLTNKGTQEIPNADWSIYWCNIRMVEPGRFPYRDGLELGQSGIKVRYYTEDEEKNGYVARDQLLYAL